MKHRPSAHPKLVGWKASLNEATATEVQISSLLTRTRQKGASLTPSKSLKEKGE